MPRSPKAVPVRGRTNADLSQKDSVQAMKAAEARLLGDPGHLTADAWSHTYRSRVVTFNPDSERVRGRIGMIIDVGRQSAPSARRKWLLQAVGDRHSLGGELNSIAGRYGPQTAALVAAQLEYPWQAGGE